MRRRESYDAARRLKRATDRGEIRAPVRGAKAAPGGGGLAPILAAGLSPRRLETTELPEQGASSSLSPSREGSSSPAPPHSHNRHGPALPMEASSDYGNGNVISVLNASPGSEMSAVLEAVLRRQSAADASRAARLVRL